MSDRNMNDFEESVIRACHHDFLGLTQDQAAEYLSVTPAKISRTLSDLQERSKTIKPLALLFPILTQNQACVYKCIAESGMSLAQTADKLSMTTSAVSKMIGAIRNKGQFIPQPIKHQQYSPLLDGQVKHKY